MDILEPASIPRCSVMPSATGTAGTRGSRSWRLCSACGWTPSSWPSIQAMHQPQSAPDRAGHRGLAGLWTASRQVIHPRFDCCVPRLLHRLAPYLGLGERGTIMVIAADRKQARVIMRYVSGLLHSVPMLSQLIEAERMESIDLANRITIEVHSALVPDHVAATPSLPPCSMNWPSGDPRKIAATPITKSSPPSTRQWPPSPMPCCYVPRRPTRARARCGRLSPLLRSGRSDPGLECRHPRR